MSADDTGSSQASRCIEVHLRLDETLRLELRDQLMPANPLPTKCALDETVLFGELHAYVRQRMAAALARGTGADEATARQSLPVTFLHVVSGGSEMVPPHESTLGSVHRIATQHPLGVRAFGEAPMTVHVRSQIFSG